MVDRLSIRLMKKILKDLWEPSAKEYERIVPRYAKGGLAYMLGE